MNNCIYIHETVDVVGHHKKKYVDYMCEYAPVSRTDRRMPLFGIWTTVGSTTRWPTAVNLWEAPDWQGMAHNFSYETSGVSGYDPKLVEWMQEAVKLRSGGYDRLLIAANYSPTSAQAVANPAIVGSLVFCHETIVTTPGRARDYLDAIGEEWVPVAARLGMALTGAFRTAMSDDSEVILIWAIRDWPTWGAVEQQMDGDPEIRAWKDRIRPLTRKRSAFLMCSGSKSPLLTGNIL